MSPGTALIPRCGTSPVPATNIYVKISSSSTAHVREVAAYQHAAQVLGSGQAPTLVDIRQNSTITSPTDTDISTTAVITAPIGVFREVQRHYITARDHLWRSGILGIRPYLEGQLASDWLDQRSGHKRVHYQLTDTGAMPDDQALLLQAMSEPFADHFVICGDVFDAVTDIAITAALGSAEQHGPQTVWDDWLARKAPKPTPT